MSNYPEGFEAFILKHYRYADGVVYCGGIAVQPDRRGHVAVRYTSQPRRMTLSRLACFLVTGEWRRQALGNLEATWLSQQGLGHLAETPLGVRAFGYPRGLDGRRGPRQYLGTFPTLELARWALQTGYIERYERGVS